VKRFRNHVLKKKQAEKEAAERTVEKITRFNLDMTLKKHGSIEFPVITENDGSSEESAQPT
jgi:hypothetical protein